MKYKNYVVGNCHIYTIKTDKFRTADIEINFKSDIRKSNVTALNLLSRLLGYTSKDYPTKRDMMIERENLYNVDCGRQLSRTGYNLFVSFNIEFLDPFYVKEKDYVENIIRFCARVLKNPDITKGKWNEKSFAIHKQKLLMAMDSYKEKPTSYAMKKSKDILYQNGLLSESLLGDKKELETLDCKTMVSYYEELLQSPCDINIIGNLDMDEVVSYLEKYLTLPSKENTSYEMITHEKTYPKDTHTTGTYHQTQLLMYYKIGALTPFEINYVTPIFMRLFGSSSGMDDKLTKSLRVDNSLCYFCGLNVQMRDFLLTIYVGLKKENVAKAKDCISKCLKEMQDGDIKEELIEIQKRKFLQDLRLREDSLYGLMDNYYFHEIDNRPMYDDYIKQIPKVTEENLKNYGLKIKELMSYVLEEEDEEN